jgi:hypothetical protein
MSPRRAAPQSVPQMTRCPAPGVSWFVRFFQEIGIFGSIGL